MRDHGYGWLRFIEVLERTEGNGLS